MSKVYDCFLFFNELDLLEIRLNELKDVVDKFVLVECSLTHASKEKPFYFEKNKERFKGFLDRIIHVKVEDKPSIPPRAGRNGTFHNRHDMEWFQRNCIDRGIKECDPSDIILLSDIDEIPSVNAVLEARKILENEDIFISLRQKFFFYYLNGLCTNDGINSVDWWGTTVCRYSSYPGAQPLRDTKGKNKKRIDQGGWHFSYLGGAEKIVEKIESYSHAEWDNNSIKNHERIKDRIDRGIDLFDRPGRPRQVYIEIDKSFPNYLFDNKEKFKDLIKQ